MQFNKCFYCKHDKINRINYPECSSCKDFNNFQPKERMSGRQAYEYELMNKLEQGISPFDMTPGEAIKRIKGHMYVHKIGEPPHFYLYKALIMAIEALEKIEED